MMIPSLLKKPIPKHIQSIHRLQYLSDIHLEKRTKIPKIPICGENLALLGDIGNPFCPTFKQFLKDMSFMYHHVFFISGNHEYDCFERKLCTKQDVDDQIDYVCNSFHNVFYLNKNSIDLYDYRLLGCTLWSKPLQNLEHRDKIRMERIELIHIDQVSWLRNEIKKENRRKTIVLTHHLPSYQMMDPRFKKYESKKDLYYSHLDWLIRFPIRYWLCGHSHIRKNYMINNVFCSVNSFSSKIKIENEYENDLNRFVYLD